MRRAFASRCVLASIAIGSIPDTAFAHTSAPGLAGFTSAMVHVVTEVPSPLALIAIGVFLGRLDDKAIGRAFAAFAAGLAFGLALTLATRTYIDPDLSLLVLSLLAGGSIAAALTLPGWGVATVSLVAGYFFGVIATPDPGPIVDLAYSVGGGAVGACWALMAVSIAVRLAQEQWNAPWLAIGLRVIGAWTVAIAALLLALLMAPPR